MMNETIELLKTELKKANGGALQPASQDEIEQAWLFGFPELLLDFYRENAPDPALPCVALDQRLWTVGNAVAENRDYVPGAELFPLGYVVFASNRYGDAYCIDTIHAGASGEYPVVLFPHDVIEEGATLDTVEKYRLTVAANLEDFLRQFTERTLIERPKYG
jgi:SMI1 / KNR4 family (SUKH-1)